MLATLIQDAITMKEEHKVSNTCENCGQSLVRGIYFAPWEDDDNEYGYTICPHCGHENVDYSTADD